ncbi:hypothetical protein FACS189426_14330 [Bacteroidia bacterium]|nr:hypothetical protein FACS189426_14330 [Bacteroidia bacterium]GHV70500.1 hypothetical protein FACS189420_1840 [Bacteroidia bacterium]
MHLLNYFLYLQLVITQNIIKQRYSYASIRNADIGKPGELVENPEEIYLLYINRKRESRSPDEVGKNKILKIGD